MNLIEEYQVEKNGKNYLIKKFAVKGGYLYQPFDENGNLHSKRKITLTSETEADTLFDPKMAFFIDALRDYFFD